MEQTYWLGRKRASAANARRARGAEARLIHLDLAGRYSVKAAAAAAAPLAPPQGARPALSLPAPDSSHYEQLETGARWLASHAGEESERQGHIVNANRYARLRLEAAAPTTARR